MRLAPAAQGGRVGTRAPQTAFGRGVHGLCQVPLGESRSFHSRTLSLGRERKPWTVRARGGINLLRKNGAAGDPRCRAEPCTCRAVRGASTQIGADLERSGLGRAMSMRSTTSEPKLFCAPRRQVTRAPPPWGLQGGRGTRETERETRDKRAPSPLALTPVGARQYIVGDVGPSPAAL